MTSEDCGSELGACKCTSFGCVKITGHKTEAVYRRYAIVSEADLSQGLKKLTKLHAGRLAHRQNMILATISHNGMVGSRQSEMPTGHATH